MGNLVTNCEDWVGNLRKINIAIRRWWTTKGLGQRFLAFFEFRTRFNRKVHSCNSKICLWIFSTPRNDQKPMNLYHNKCFSDTQKCLLAPPGMRQTRLWSTGLGYFSDEYIWIGHQEDIHLPAKSSLLWIYQGVLLITCSSFSRLFEWLSSCVPKLSSL